MGRLAADLEADINARLEGMLPDVNIGQKVSALIARIEEA
jgi:hypothetical protein